MLASKTEQALWAILETMTLLRGWYGPIVTAAVYKQLNFIAEERFT